MDEARHEDDLDEWARRLLQGEPVAAVVIEELDEDELAYVASHPDLTWAILRDQPDRDAAVHLFEHRVQAILEDGSDWDALVEDIDSRNFAGDAASYPELEATALRVAVSLAWLDPAAADHICRVLGSRPSESARPESARSSQPDALHAICRRALTIAPQWRALRRIINVPRPLVRFVSLQWVASRTLLDELIADLRSDMTARSGVYLEVFDFIARDHFPLLAYIVGLSERFLPERPASLGELGDDEQKMLVSALEQIDEPVFRSSGARLWRAIVGAVTVGALVSLAGYDSAAVAAMGSLMVVSVVYKAWFERSMYGRLVRPQLAAYLASVGTPTSCVASWLGQNQQSVKKIDAFDLAIDGDEALSAIARLGRMTRLHRGLMLGNRAG